MSAKPVSLAVHRNTVEKRRARIVRKDMGETVRQFTSQNDIRAYAIIALDAEGNMHAYWDTGSVMPMWAFPDVMAAGLRREMETSGVDDTWKPPLPIKG